MQSKDDKRQIDEAFAKLLKAFNRTLSEEEEKTLTKAFKFGNKAHMGIRRKSGEPYFLHPLAVATIAVGDIGLGIRSAVAGILHDVIEDTDYTREDIEALFGENVANIVEGLTKVKGSFESAQAVNFRKMLLTLSEDVRVTFIKLADRLHNMRTLDSMPQNKQLKISGETLYVYAPLAHRLGLYSIKSELEDLAFKYQMPDAYSEIKLKIRNGRYKQNELINNFIAPIESKLKGMGIDYEIKGREKTAYSIYKKIHTQGISFDQVYDLLAIRIIFKPDTNSTEKLECFRIYSQIKDIYDSNKDGRFRDWLSKPKANGYEALHDTLMGPDGKWVEVQIRTRRMDDIAEKGLAAHYKYKEGEETTANNELDKWLAEARESLTKTDSNELEFLERFKLNLYNEEISVFTPKGETKTLPAEATVLDFAYSLHTELGDCCLGAKVNHKSVPIYHKLINGDQVEIISSATIQLKPRWANFVITSKANEKIKYGIRKIFKDDIKRGKKMLVDELAKYKISIIAGCLNKMRIYYRASYDEQILTMVGNGEINLKELPKILNIKPKSKLSQIWELTFKTREKDRSKIDNKKIKSIVLAKDQDEYLISSCCNPEPGDDIIGILAKDETIEIHKKECSEAVTSMVNYGDTLISASWKTKEKEVHLVTLKIEGRDRKGIVTDIITPLTGHRDVNMRQVHFDAHDGIFEGTISLYTTMEAKIEKLTEKLKLIKEVETVTITENNKK